MQRIVSCYSNSYGPSGVWAAVRGVADAGLTHIELALRGHDFGGLIIPESVVITENSTQAEIAEFHELLQERNVHVVSCNVGGGDLRTSLGYELTASRMKFANKVFGVAVAVTGVGQPNNSEERSTVVNHLKELGQLSESLDMDLSLETHKGPTQNAVAMTAIITEVDHPRVLLNFDTGNIAYYNQNTDVIEELIKVRHFVRSVHLKDSRGLYEDWFFPSVGSGGAVDFIKVRRTLDEIGFVGPYTIEIEGIGGEAEPGLEIRRDRVKESVEHLRLCGFFDEIS